MKVTRIPMQFGTTFAALILKRTTAAAAIATIGLLSLSLTTAEAQFTWDGGGADNNFSTADNWAGDVAPVADGQVFNFDGVTRLTPNNNITLSGLDNTFNFLAGAGAFTITNSQTSIRMGTASNASAFMQTFNTDVRFGGSRTIDTGAGGLTFNAIGATGGSSRTVTKNGSGTLRINGLGSSGAFVAFNVAAGTLAFHNTGNMTISSVISGLGALEQNGAGTTTLSGTNTRTGNTTVNAGALTLATAGQMAFNIGDSGVNNQINGVGTLTLNGAFNFNLASASNGFGDMWQIVNNATLNETYSATFSVVGFVETADVWSAMANGVEYQFSEATGVLTVVPEPGTVVMLLGSMGVFMMVRRRRRS